MGQHRRVLYSRGHPDMGLYIRTSARSRAMRPISQRVRRAPLARRVVSMQRSWGRLSSCGVYSVRTYNEGPCLRGGKPRGMCSMSQSGLVGGRTGAVSSTEREIKRSKKRLHLCCVLAKPGHNGRAGRGMAWRASGTVAGLRSITLGRRQRWVEPHNPPGRPRGVEVRASKLG